MAKLPLTADSVLVIGKSIPLGHYHAFLREATGLDMPGSEFLPWIHSQEGRKLGDLIEPYADAAERKSMDRLLAEPRFDFISPENKAFILAFDEEMRALGYDCGGGIGDGACWGSHMIIYSKVGVKKGSVAARIYIGDYGINLRLYLNGIDKHIAYIESAPPYIKRAFEHGDGECKCQPKPETCKFRKSYTLDGERVDKCNGEVFYYRAPTMEHLPEYVALLHEFYPVKRAKQHR